MKQRFLITLLLLILLPCRIFSQDKVSYSFSDRTSLKTNAFEWLVTVPNIGVEFDVTRSEFRKMSLSLTAKYNWNTWHQKAPALVFDLFDVRPEFRYYLRTENQKLSRPWWTMYLGPYLSYGNYTFKLGPKGISGWSAGAGVSFGYCIPMYEYKKGAVDVEFGLSVGLQACTRDVFTHNPEGYYYTRLEEESKGVHFTPFPVLSELRVAFVWRRESIRHQVKIDNERLAREEKLKRDYNLVLEDISKNLPLSSINDYQTLDAFMSEMEYQKTYLKGENCIRSSVYGFDAKSIKKLDKKVMDRIEFLQREFNKKINKEKE